jgi:hypothetical protein
MKRSDLWGWTLGPVEFVFHHRRLVTLAVTFRRHTYRPIDR